MKQTPDNTAKNIWQRLLAGNGAWRTPVLATSNATSGADARTVVLREVNIAERELIFHTAADSGKCRQLEHDPRCCLVIYDPDALQQLRLYGNAERITDEIRIESNWNSLADRQQRVYGLKRSIPARQNFAVYRVIIHTMHQLHLADPLRLTDHGRNDAQLFHWNENAAVVPDGGSKSDSKTGTWSAMSIKP